MKLKMFRPPPSAICVPSKISIASFIFLVFSIARDTEPDVAKGNMSSSCCLCSWIEQLVVATVEFLAQSKHKQLLVFPNYKTNKSLFQVSGKRQIKKIPMIRQYNISKAKIT